MHNFIYAAQCLHDYMHIWVLSICSLRLLSRVCLHVEPGEGYWDSPRAEHTSGPGALTRAARWLSLCPTDRPTDRSPSPRRRLVPRAAAATVSCPDQPPAARRPPPSTCPVARRVPAWESVRGGALVPSWPPPPSRGRVSYRAAPAQISEAQRWEERWVARWWVSFYRFSPNGCVDRWLLSRCPLRNAFWWRHHVPSSWPTLRPIRLCLNLGRTS